jgi:hypothetical protein
MIRVNDEGLDRVVQACQAVTAVAAYSLLSGGVLFAVLGRMETGRELLAGGVGVGAMFFGLVSWGKQRRDDRALRGQAKAMAWLSAVEALDLSRPAPELPELDWDLRPLQRQNLKRLQQRLLDLQPLAAHLGHVPSGAAAASLRWAHLAEQGIRTDSSRREPWQARHLVAFTARSQLLRLALELIVVEEFDLEFAARAEDLKAECAQLEARAEAAANGRLILASRFSVAFTDPKGAHWVANELYRQNGSPGLGVEEHDEPTRVVIAFTCSDGRTVEGQMAVESWLQCSAEDLQRALGGALDRAQREP